MKANFRSTAVLLLLAIFFSSVHAESTSEEENVDPWQGLNQGAQKFNDTLDDFLLRPVAKTYTAVLPNFVRRGVSNVFGNLDDVRNSLNNVLQGKPKRGLSDLARILINSTIGIGGLFDPASGFGLRKSDESFGQTLSVWGVPSGPYLVLPFFGPSTLTDTVARPVNSVLDPLRYLHPVDHRNSLFGVRTVDQRAGLLGAEKVIFGDRYLFLRDAYLQRRDYQVNDGKVVDDFDDF